MHHCAKFNQNRSRGCKFGDLTVFRMAGIRHFGFVKFYFLTVSAVKKPILTTVPNFVKIGQTAAEMS